LKSATTTIIKLDDSQIEGYLAVFVDWCWSVSWLAGLTWFVPVTLRLLQVNLKFIQNEIIMKVHSEQVHSEHYRDEIVMKEGNNNLKVHVEAELAAAGLVALSTGLSGGGQRTVWSCNLAPLFVRMNGGNYISKLVNRGKYLRYFVQQELEGSAKPTLQRYVYELSLRQTFSKNVQGC
jgi:hypothetical protein